MKRRELLIALCGWAAALAARRAGAKVDGMWRIGVLMGYAESDWQGQANFAALREGLRSLGWTEGRDIRIEGRRPTRI